jgi:hypothetical protein
LYSPCIRLIFTNANSQQNQHYKSFQQIIITMGAPVQKFESALISDLEKKFGIWLRPKEFGLLFPEIKNYRSIHRKYLGIKDSLGKKEHQLLTIQEAADWLGIPPQKIYQIVHL